MERETTADFQQQAGKVYKEREIWVGALLGGALAAGYMAAANYKAFGEGEKVRRTWIVAVAATVFLLCIAFFAPYVDRIPNSVFTFVWAATIIAVVQVYQGERIRRHIRGRGLIQSWWKTVGVSLAALAVTTILFVGVTFVVTGVEEYNTRTKTYGKLQHEVSYNKNNISESEVNWLAEASIKSNLLLESSGKWYAYARKVGTSYEISVSVNRATINDAEYLKFVAEARGYIQAQFPNNKIVVNLVEGDFGDVKKRIE